MAAGCSNWDLSLSQIRSAHIDDAIRPGRGG
jgi:hypothetical protein